MGVGHATAHDVAVLGYGPVGAILANLLGRAGLRVVVVEQAAEVYDKPRAITADHEMLHALQLCGLGRRLPGVIAPHPGTDYLGVDGGVIRSFDPMPPPFPLGWIPTAVFIQPELEAALREVASELPDVSVRLSSRATQVEEAGDRVRVLTEHAGTGAREVIEARFLVACDGASSPTRRRLGIGVEDLAFDEWWMVVDALRHGPEGFPPKCIQYCWPERPSTYIPGPRDLVRWEIKLLPGEDPRAFGEAENVRRQVARFIDPEAVEIWRSAVYRFHALVAERWRRGRVILAGDAAHQMPPFLGQGLCAGVRDAVNLAWKLRMVLRDGAPEALLDSYEAERKPHIRTVVARAKEAGLVIGELDLERARERDARLRRQIVVNRQDVIPRIAHGLIDRDSGEVAGTLAVQPRLVTPEGPALMDDVLGPAFVMLFRDTADLAWLGEAERAALARLGGRALAVLPRAEAGEGATAEEGSLARDWLDRHGARAALIRPDRHAYGIARDAEGARRLVRGAAAAVFEEERTPQEENVP
ncbi:bifunctional 3-(3-hydroxy-phenyl)propionate/3-hydroxycinnamic acid hydroxylase [Roseomonas populi]|uniref:Bifunctional 3-(3-hydroxy-phenyl)propionate/3-hydroxycinnamic acid hydroxylase n=1 Tax=Roseomonas populi TaxID=3121582 RepID=A0ABT1XFF2_9PROT|nr:bifunctional 3-(3-hydroxy-phenyl)propionate/3-hydroxycinnamic acid hydroxylase [Roseomonas pecuniae]MCR0985699.1 bifunctional 3-(3-hydroxy-phenyl)propionate/3-hydroxycinnamic acid hydroxylase [Roseomonas pecuniae]